MGYTYIMGYVTNSISRFVHKNCCIRDALKNFEPKICLSLRTWDMGRATAMGGAKEGTI